MLMDLDWRVELPRSPLTSLSLPTTAREIQWVLEAIVLMSKLLILMAPVSFFRFLYAASN